jgi:hypothetical protein
MKAPFVVIATDLFDLSYYNNTLETIETIGQKLQDRICRIGEY